MSLHDRIMDLPKGVFAGYEYTMGYETACETSAMIAKEADELIEECECALSDAVEVHGSMHALKVLNKIKKYRETTK